MTEGIPRRTFMGTAAGTALAGAAGEPAAGAARARIVGISASPRKGKTTAAALFCQEMIVVGDGRPTAHTGATVLNNGSDDIGGDEFGLSTVRNLGRRVAEVASLLAR